jgi:tetratricopeptide (TPR) repeat protein
VTVSTTPDRDKVLVPKEQKTADERALAAGMESQRSPQWPSLLAPFDPPSQTPSPADPLAAFPPLVQGPSPVPSEVRKVGHQTQDVLPIPRMLPDPQSLPDTQVLPAPKTLPAPQMLPAPQEKKDPQGKKDAEGLPEPRSDSDKLPTENPGPEGAAILGLARIAVQENDLTEALRRFDEYLKRYPNDLAVRLEMAGVLVRAGERNRAIEEYRRLLTARPGNPEVSLGLANVYFSAQQFSEAVPLLRAALEKSPKDLNLAARLARAYALDREFLHAQEVFDRYFKDLKPGDAKVPRDLTALLLDLQRPADALAFLLPQREKRKEEAQFLIELVRAYARVGENGPALQALADLASLDKSSFTNRLDLGKDLISSGDDLVAAAVFNQILAADPGNLTAQLGLAQVLVRQHLPLQALGTLTGIKPTAALSRQWTIVWAEYHQLVGEYFEARERYQNLLAKDSRDVEVRMALAKLMQYTAEYEKAKAQYGAVPPAGGRGRQARLGIAATLFDQRRFAESVECCERLLAEDPADGEAMAQLLRNHIKTGGCTKAIALGRGFLANFANLEPVAIPVRLALARALLECGRFPEAAQDYECLLARPGGRIPDAWYGLARALAKMNQAAKADQVLVAAFSDPGHETRNRLMIADLFYADYDDPHADELARSVLQHEPKNLAALIRLADAQLREARPSAHIEAVVQTAKVILDLSPTNVRGQLALARAYSIVQDFPSAVAQYDRLLAVDPSFLIPQIEKARALFSGHQFNAAEATYQRAQQPAPEELLRNGLASFLQLHSEFRPQLGPCLELGAGHSLQGEVTKLAATLGDPAGQAAVHALILEAEARAAEINVIRLEAAAKCARDWRNFTAKPLYEKLVTVDPNSVEGFFDLGQVDGQLKQTHNALIAFSQALQIDPLDREAGIALQRASLALNPNVTLLGNVFNQNGRQGEANVTRYRGGALVNFPIGEEDEVIGVGYQRLFDSLPGFHSLGGDMFTLNASKRVDDHLLLYELGNIENYADRISTRPTYEIGARCVVLDGMTVIANTFLNNVIENGESVQQDIYRVGANLGVEAQLTRFWLAGGNYRFAYYSDINRMSELSAHTDVLACLPPEQLKFVARVDYLTYNHQTVFGPDGSIVGSIHPYFAPAGYTFAEGRVEYTHWFSRDYFNYSNQCYVSLQYGLGFDNNAVVYNDFRGILNWDVTPCLSLGIEAEAQVSQVYNMQQAFAYLIWRLPGRP